MAQTKILLDSNSYFRLAKSIHPLLFQEFGRERYCLYVLRELQDEFDRQPRLQRKFSWVDNPEFRENRSKMLSLSRIQNNKLPTVFDFMWDHVLAELPGPSRVDVTILSHAYVLGIPVVTDDNDMRELAIVFGVQVFKTLELLKIMLDADHVDLSKIRQVVSYWSYENDLPTDYVSDFRRLFAEPPPP